MLFVVASAIPAVTSEPFLIYECAWAAVWMRDVATLSARAVTSETIAVAIRPLALVSFRVEEILDGLSSLTRRN